MSTHTIEKIVNPSETASWNDRLQRARAALIDVTPRFLDLVRSAGEPGANAVGDWTVAEVALHLSHVAAGDTMIAAGAGRRVVVESGPDQDIVTAAASFNRASLEGDPERDLSALADRIEETVTGFLDATAGVRGDEPVVFLGGVVLPSGAIACHLLEEILVHGHDVALVERRPWRIAREHAALGFGFLFDLIRFCDEGMSRAFADQQASVGLRASFDVRMRGARRDFVTFEDGVVTVTSSQSRPIDCHISIDPVAALLIGMGRLRTTRPLLTGKILVWGHKPWLATRFTSLFRNP